jgi:serine/threonine-protein kinase
MGTVYLVEDTSIGKKYALKTVNREFADRIDMAARMRKEARALVALRDRNIVDVITMGQTADDLRLVFILMEYLEGYTLKSILRDKGRLDVLHVLDIGIDVANALQKAHTEGFVHRDIKPDNIFLVVEGGGATAKAVVLDFGIIGVHDQEAVEDRGQFMFTPRYGAPEQVRGGRCHAQSDLYSLAVVMFEAIAGHGPFPGVRGPVNLSNAHLNQPAPRLSKFVPDVDPDLDALLYAAMQKEPSDRIFVDKATGRHVPVTAMSMGVELGRIRRDEGARRGEQVDENKTQETLLGVMHARAPESTVDDPNIAEHLAGVGPGRATTLVGLAPVDQGTRRERDPSGSGRSPPGQTPVVTESRHLFPPTPEMSPAPRSPQPEELLSRLGGGMPHSAAALENSHSPRQSASPAMLAPPTVVASSLRGVPASTDPMPLPRTAARPVEPPPESSPGPPMSDSWRQVQAARALAEQVAAAAGAQPAYQDEMDAAKARIPLMGPAAGRLRPPMPPLEPPIAPSRDSTDPSASRTLAPALPLLAADPQPRKPRAPLVITLVALGACVIVIVCAAVVVASRSWRSSSVPATPTASATTPADTIGAPTLPASAAPAASPAPAPAPSTETVEASINSSPSVAPAARPRVAPQTAKPPPRTPSLITTAPLGSGGPPDVGDPFKKTMGW